MRTKHVVDRGSRSSLLSPSQVLQLPIVKAKLKKILTTAVKKVAAAGGAPVIPSSDDSLEDFLVTAGKFFGKDPSEWVEVGESRHGCAARGADAVASMHEQ